MIKKVLNELLEQALKFKWEILGFTAWIVAILLVMSFFGLTL